MVLLNRFVIVKLHEKVSHVPGHCPEEHGRNILIVKLSKRRYKINFFSQILGFCKRIEIYNKVIKD